MDNVDAQTRTSFQQAMKECQTQVFYGEPGPTHVWQAVDRHIGRSIKRMLADAQVEAAQTTPTGRAFLSCPPVMQESFPRTGLESGYF